MAKQARTTLCLILVIFGAEQGFFPGCRLLSLTPHFLMTGAQELIWTSKIATPSRFFCFCARLQPGTGPLCCRLILRNLNEIALSQFGFFIPSTSSLCHSLFSVPPSHEVVQPRCGYFLRFVCTTLIAVAGYYPSSTWLVEFDVDQSPQRGAPGHPTRHSPFHSSSFKSIGY